MNTIDKKTETEKATVQSSEPLRSPRFWGAAILGLAFGGRLFASGKKTSSTKIRAAKNSVARGKNETGVRA